MVVVDGSNRSACRASNSAGGRSPSDWCRRAWLNQPRYSTIASSSCERVCQTRSAITSVLIVSTKLSASALMLGAALGTHRDRDAGVAGLLAEAQRHELRSPVGMMDQ